MHREHRRRLTLGLAAMVIFAGLVAGCREEPKIQPATVTLRVSGSGTSIPLVEALGREFTTRHPTVVFQFLPSTHTAGAVNGVWAGEIEIGALSRELTPEEKQLAVREIWLARDPVIFIVHQEIGITTLSVDQLRKIYSGRVSNWKALGGPDLPISVLDRPEHASAKMVLRDAVLGKDFVVSPSAISVERASDIHQAVTSVPGGIGYTSWSLFQLEKPNLAVLAVGGVAPSAAAVRDKSYTLVRPFGIVIPSGQNQAATSFAEFCVSGEGREIASRQFLYPW